MVFIRLSSQLYTGFKSTLNDKLLFGCLIESEHRKRSQALFALSKANISAHHANIVFPLAILGRLSVSCSCPPFYSFNTVIEACVMQWPERKCPWLWILSQVEVCLCEWVFFPGCQHVRMAAYIIVWSSIWMRVCVRHPKRCLWVCVCQCSHPAEVAVKRWEQTLAVRGRRVRIQGSRISHHVGFSRCSCFLQLFPAAGSRRSGRVRRAPPSFIIFPSPAIISMLTAEVSPLSPHPLLCSLLPSPPFSLLFWNWPYDFHIFFPLHLSPQFSSCHSLLFVSLCSLIARQESQFPFTYTEKPLRLPLLWVSLESAADLQIASDMQWRL